MNFLNSQFPYPVLMPGSNDYIRGKFEVEVGCRVKGNLIFLSFKAVLTNKDILGLIKTGEASFVYLLDCPITGFRCAKKTQKESYTVSLFDYELSGKLKITPMVALNTDISGFSSEDFHSDYQGIAFDLEAGNVLAAAHSIEVFIDKTNLDLGDSESIFSIVSMFEESERNMIVDYQSSDKILIKLPQIVFNSYGILSKDMSNTSLLNSLVVVPSLIYVLTSLSREWKEGSLLEDYEDKRWFRQIAKILKDRFSLDILTDKFWEQEDLMVLAQQMAGSPLEQAFDSIFDNGDDSEEESL